MGLAIHSRLELLTGNGCALHPDCFTCPFAECVYDDDPATVLRALRDAQILKMAHRGMCNTDIGRIFQLGNKQVRRILTTVKQ